MLGRWGGEECILKGEGNSGVAKKKSTLRCVIFVAGLLVKVSGRGTAVKTLSLKSICSISRKQSREFRTFAA